MDSDPQFDGVLWSVADFELLDGSEQVERHGSDLGSMGVVRSGQTTDHHVGVAYSLYLIHIVILDDRVERCVQVI